MKRSALRKSYRLQRGFPLRGKSEPNSSNACKMFDTLQLPLDTKLRGTRRWRRHVCAGWQRRWTYVTRDTISFLSSCGNQNHLTYVRYLLTTPPRSYHLHRQFRVIERLWCINPFYFSVGRFCLERSTASEDDNIDS